MLVGVWSSTTVSHLYRARYSVTSREKDEKRRICLSARERASRVEREVRWSHVFIDLQSYRRLNFWPVSISGEIIMTMR